MSTFIKQATPLKSAHRVVAVTKDDLPLQCPMPRDKDNPLWATHPKVFLPIEAQTQVVCPYCNTGYYLEATDHEEKNANSE